MRRCVLLLMIWLMACHAFGAGIDELVSQAKSIDKPEESLDIAQRFFDGGSYADALRLYDALLENPNFTAIPPKPSETGSAAERRQQRQKDREQTLFYRARCLLSLAKGDSAQIDRAIHDFNSLADRRHLRFEAPRYYKEAVFYIGKAYLLKNDPANSVKAFRQLFSMNPPADLDTDAVLYMADALTLQATLLEPGRQKREDLEKQRLSLLQMAIRELNRIATNYPANPRWREVDLRLMQLRLETGQYADVAALADGFLKRETQRTTLRAQGVLMLAQSAYYRGELDEAALLYERILREESPAAKTELDALYGLGWSYARLARLAGPEQQEKNLSRAQAVFRRALQKMPFNDLRRNDSLFELARTSVRLGEPDEAFTLIRPLLSDPVWREQAHYLAGIALRDQKLYAEATRHFAEVLRISGDAITSPSLLRALEALAELENDLGRHSKAYLHYLQLRDLAKKHRNAATSAQAELGIARSLIALGRPSASNGEGGVVAPVSMPTAARENLKIASEFGEDLRVLFPVTEASLNEAPGLCRSLAFSLQALSMQMRKPVTCLDQAYFILERLHERFSDRLRMDELEYEMGRALFYKAELKRESLMASSQVRLPDARLLLEFYDTATKTLTHATRVNPRSQFAARIHYLLGQVYYQRAELAFYVARRLREIDQPEDAQPYHEEGKKSLTSCVAPFQFTAQSSKQDSSLRYQALWSMGVALYDLEEFEKALVQFDGLSADPSVSTALRRKAVQRAAKVLVRLGDREQALRRLRPYLESDLSATLLAGEILVAQQRFRQAFDTYLRGVKMARKPERAQVAEAQYHAYTLALQKGKALLRRGEEEERLLQDAIAALRRLTKEYSDIPWAGEALLTLAHHFLAQGDTKEARRLVQEHLKAFRSRPATIQALHLLEGRTYAAEGNVKEAMRAYRQVERISDSSKENRALRAEALLEQGNMALAEGEELQALQHYTHVFAVFQNVHAMADKARLAAAQLHAKRNNLRKALEILENGTDKQKMLEMRLQLESALPEGATRGGER